MGKELTDADCAALEQLVWQGFANYANYDKPHIFDGFTKYEAAEYWAMFYTLAGWSAEALGVSLGDMVRSGDVIEYNKEAERVAYWLSAFTGATVSERRRVASDMADAYRVGVFSNYEWDEWNQPDAVAKIQRELVCAHMNGVDVDALLNLTRRAYRQPEYVKAWLEAQSVGVLVHFYSATQHLADMAEGEHGLFDEYMDIRATEEYAIRAIGDTPDAEFARVAYEAINKPKLL